MQGLILCLPTISIHVDKSSYLIGVERSRVEPCTKILLRAEKLDASTIDWNFSDKLFSGSLAQLALFYKLKIV